MPPQNHAPQGVDSQFGDTITIPLNSLYKKELPIALNEFGVPFKDRYRNEDLAKILGVHPTTIQWRCDRSKYVRLEGCGRPTVVVRQKNS